tara:strand:+ start:9027 stop:9968 length:942 start_codon:yes stop_codon:yes gene_type:complete
MPFSISLTQGYTFSTDGTDKVTYSKLNQLGAPVISLSGTINEADIDGDAVTTPKIKDDAVTGPKIIDGAIGLSHLLAADQGTFLHHGAAGWELLPPGTDGQVLTTKGAAADATWSVVPGVTTVAPNNITPGTAGEHLVTDGDGNTAWEPQAAGDAPGVITRNSKVTVRDEKTSGTNSGSSVSGTQTRDLTDITDGNGIGATLAANVISLPAGVYHIHATVPAYQVDGHQAFLWKTNGSATELVTGSSAYATTGTGAGLSNASIIDGTFTLSVDSTLEIRHMTNTNRFSFGLGRSHGIFGRVEIFTQATFTKLD